MAKIFGKLKNLYLNIYKDRSAGGMILLSLSMLASFLWPLLGAIVYLIYRFRKPSWRSYGTMALTGICANLVLYIVQIAMKLAAIM